TVLPAAYLNVVDTLNHASVLMTEDAVRVAQELWGAQDKTVAPAAPARRKPAARARRAPAAPAVEALPPAPALEELPPPQPAAEAKPARPSKARAPVESAEMPEV